MDREVYLKNKENMNIYCYIRKPEKAKAVLVMMHGLGESSDSFYYGADLLYQAGITTYCPEHRGHGRSEGERAYYDNVDAIFDDFDLSVQLAMKENPDLPIFLYGHSMGGYTVALYAAKNPKLRIRGVITSGAVVEDNQGIFKGLEKNLDLHTELENTFTTEICTVKERVDEFRSNPMSTLFSTPGLAYTLCEGIDWFADHMQDVCYPIFMTHGEEDPIVSVQDTYDFFKKVGSKDKEMKIYGGCHHAIFHEFCRDEVFTDYITWISKRI
ncbi:MAG: lysophospholipase [Lachnospiraceae bacterium]|nr:lysophospholipase [Lachnospiraceae bacterium]